MTKLPDIKADIQISTKDLAPVAEKLIDKISDAIGTVYEPTKKRREAKALAEVKQIEFKTALQERAFKRLMHEEERNQLNMDAITVEAIEYLEEDAKPQDISDDWLADFFDKARKVSSEDMQALWSRILAGEANTPDSYSKSALHVASLINHKDAELFVVVCRFMVFLDSGELMPIILNYEDPFYTKAGLNFGTLSHLRDLGLISVASLSDFTRSGFPQTFVLHYAGKSLKFTLPEGKNDIVTGKVRFTHVGAQLLRLTDAEEEPDFIPYLIKKYKKYNVTVELI